MFVLNDMQRAAVEHEGPSLLIVAGAGTGKTTTLAARLAYLIDKGADPARLLLLTFSRRAAHELIARAARHADPRTTMRYDRARKNLDRHPNYILAAYMASGT